jgi:Domain of unknown function (DUF4902)
MRHSSALFDSPSRDGYVRLPEQALAHLQLVHVESGLDDDLLKELRADDIDAVRAGYTEWHRIHLPGTAYVSVGWDWYLDRASDALLIAWGDVRSNVMCFDWQGVDIGMARTAQLLMHRLALLDWPSTIARATLTSVCEPDAERRTLQ